MNFVVIMKNFPFVISFFGPMFCVYFDDLMSVSNFATSLLSMLYIGMVELSLINKFCLLMRVL